MNKKLCIIIVFVSILFLLAIAESSETLPVYKLSVSFDVEKNLLRGDAHITFPEDGTRDILTRSLSIISITFNGQPLVREIKDGTFKNSGKGTLETIYEGYFPEEQQIDASGIVSSVGEHYHHL